MRSLLPMFHGLPVLSLPTRKTNIAVVHAPTAALDVSVHIFEPYPDHRRAEERQLWPLLQLKVLSCTKLSTLIGRSVFRRLGFLFLARCCEC